MRKLIPNYDNYYIDENGNIFNTASQKELKGSIGENGYKYYRLSKNNTKKMFYAHRLVAEAFIPNPQNLEVVNHIDGNKLNNNVNNLQWVSYSENTAHAYANKLIAERGAAEFYTEDLEDETWMKLDNFNYSISSQGRIRNDATNRLLKPSIVCGYYKARISNQGIVKDIMIHKQVYCSFNHIDEIPNGFTVDHINGNKLDNSLSNLRLLSLSDNVKAAYYETKTNSSCKEVAQYTLDGQLLNTYPSAAEAARQLNLDSSTISKVCRGVNKTHGGFVFRYLNK